MPDVVPYIMISSTYRDLSEHREAVRTACQRHRVLSLMKEYQPASPDDTIQISLKLVEEADIYVGIFAFYYGDIPEGHEISITEMEYNHAVRLGKPKLIYVMHKDHEVQPGCVETGPGALKLAALKKRLLANMVGFFKSPDDLCAQVSTSLAAWLERNPRPSLRVEAKPWTAQYSSLARKEQKPKDMIIAEEPEKSELSGPPQRPAPLSKNVRDDEVDAFVQLCKPRLLAEIDRLAYSQDRGGYITRNEILDGVSLLKNTQREFAIRALEQMIDTRFLIDRSGSIELHPRSYALLGTVDIST